MQDYSPGAPKKNASADMTPTVIGVVRSPIKKLKDCPKWNTDGPEAFIELDPAYAKGLDGMEAGQRITLLTWLHQAERGVLHLRSRHGITGAPRGVFNSRSPARPTPIGLHDVTVLEVKIQGSSPGLKVNALEALDGTPVLDIKTERNHYFVDPTIALDRSTEALTAVCAGAHNLGVMSGFSGNASMRLGDYCLITVSGSAKGGLGKNDFTLMGIADAKVYMDGATPSSESLAHLAVYRNQPAARAILHSHPPALLALGVRYPDKSLKERLNLPIFEAAALQEAISSVPRLAPGTEALAGAVGQCAKNSRIIWMEGHGLLVWSVETSKLLPMTEELEHLARIALSAGAV